MPEPAYSPRPDFPVRGPQPIIGKEIRRFVYELSEEIHNLQGLTWLSKRYATGREYHLLPTEEKAFLSDCQKHRIDIATLERQFQSADFYIPYGNLLGKFFHRALPDPDQWAYLSPVSRRWLRLIPFGDGQVYLRGGWTLMRRRRTRHAYYYLDPARDRLEYLDIDELQVRDGHKAILSGYGAIKEYKEISFHVDAERNFCILFWPGYAVPPVYLDFLKRLSLQMFQSGDYGFALLFHLPDKFLLDRALHALHFNTVPKELSEDWLDVFSNILDSFHSHACRNIGQRLSFWTLSLTKWASSFKENNIATGALLETVLNQARLGDPTARQIRKLLKSDLASCYWPEASSGGRELYGVFLEDADISFQGKDTDLDLFRVAFPEFGVVASWRTTKYNRSLVRDFPAIGFSGKGQFLPVLGYLRINKGTEIQPRSGLKKRMRELMKWSYSAIPSTERDIFQSGGLFGYILDFDSSRWRGYSDLSRYVYITGKVVQRSPDCADLPSLKLVDCFGEEFLMDTSCLSPMDKEILPSFGDVIGGFCRISAHDFMSCSLPMFHLLGRDWLTSHETDVSSQRYAVTAAVRYLYDPTRGGLARFFYGSPISDISHERLGELVEDGILVTDSSQYYWKYPYLSSPEMTSLVQQASDVTPEGYLFRSLKLRLHPKWALTYTPSTNVKWVSLVKGPSSDALNVPDEDLVGDV